MMLRTVLCTVMQRVKSPQLQRALMGGNCVCVAPQVMQEFLLMKQKLQQLMMSAYAFLHSDTFALFLEELASVCVMYDTMHDLPVVKKRMRCAEMVRSSQNVPCICIASLACC